MYIKNESFEDKNSCKDCRHSSICKYCNDMNLKIDIVNGISDEPLSPVKIKITCKNFERKNLKQDGVVFRY